MQWRPLTGLLLLVACGGPHFAQDGEDVEPLRWAIEQQVQRYHVTQSMRVRVDAEEGATTGSWRRTEFATTVEMAKPDASGRAQVTVTYDGLRGEIEDARGSFVFDGAWVPAAGDRSPRARAIRELRRQYLDDAYSYLVDARGEIEIIRAAETSLGEAWPDWVGPLPNSPSKPGDTWQSEALVDRPLVGKLRAITTLRLGENGRYGITPCVMINFQTHYAWPQPDEAPSVGVDPKSLQDSGTLCFGFDGVPLQQTIVATRRGTSEAGEVAVEFKQTRSWIPSRGPIPWTIEVPAAPPAPAAPTATLAPVTPALPDGALLRLGSAQGTFWGRIDDLEPAPNGTRLAIASGPSITFFDAAKAERTASILAPCAALREVVWAPDGTLVLGLCEPDEGDREGAIHVWQVADGELLRSVPLPETPARVSVALLEGRASGFAVDVRGGLWRFDLLGEAPAQAIALTWPSAAPASDGGGSGSDAGDSEADGGERPDDDPGDAGIREDGGVYPEPNDPLEFSRFVVAPDGFYAAGVADGRLVLVDAGAQQVRRVMTDPEVVVRDLVWLPDRPGVFALAVDNRIELWSADGEAALPGASVTLAGPEWEGAERLSVSADGKRLLAWQAKQGATLWRLSGAGLVADVRAIDARTHAALTADGRYVVSRSRYANALHLFDLKKGAAKPLSGPHGERLAELAVAPDGKHVVTADLNGWTQVWRVAAKGEARGDAQARFRVAPPPQKYGDVADTFVAFSGPDRLLVGHPLGGGFRRLDGRPLRSIEEGLRGVERVQVDARGRRALTLGHGYSGVAMWSLEGRDPRELWSERRDARSVYQDGPYICGARLARGGARVALQWSDGRVEVRPSDGGRAILEVSGDPGHCRPTLSGDGERLAYLDPQSAAIQVVDLKGRVVASLPGSRSLLYGALLLDDDGDRVVAARGRSLWLFGLGDTTTTRTLAVPEGEIALIAALGEDRFVTGTSHGTSALIWRWE